jgi:CheY-like chemotaxis protein
MPVILIADACKPSLVMSSEVFKDKIAGATILVAANGRQCLELLAQKPDMCVVDFDLPDTDGVTLIHAMRKSYRGPILLTAFPDKIVDEAVNSDLFAFNDAGGWIPKPVKFDILSAKIDQFLVEKNRLGRRFETALDTLIIGGACIELDELLKIKGGDEMMVALSLPAEGAPVVKAKPAPTLGKKPALKPGAKARPTPTTKKPVIPESKIKATVCWVDKKSSRAGFAFARLTDIQRKALEELLRGSQA